jgi:hypothetical protein
MYCAELTVFEKIILTIFVALIMHYTQTLSSNSILCVILVYLPISIWYFEYLYRCLGETLPHLQNKLAQDHLNHSTPLHRNSYKQQCTHEAQSNILSYCATVNVCTRVQKQHFESLEICWFAFILT